MIENFLTLPPERRSPTRQVFESTPKRAGSEIGAPQCQSSRGQCQDRPIEKAAFRFLRTTVVKFPVKFPLSPATIMVSALLLSFLLHSDRVQADGCPAPSFAEARNFPASGCAVSVAVGDFNGDGKNDLVLGTVFPFDCCTFNVPVLLGNGDGTFQPALNSYAGPNPTTVAVGDFNGDSKPDVAVHIASYTKNISVLLGQGDGKFQPLIQSSTVGGFLVPGDFNSDGKLDLASANYVSFDQNSRTYTNGNLSVVSGNGDGTFSAATAHIAGLHPFSVAISDFNADGKFDLAVINFGDPYSSPQTNGSATVLLGRGDGSFNPAVNYSAGVASVSGAVGDFNGDGTVDLAVANIGSYYQGSFTNSSVSVLLGKGDGTFQAAVNYDAGAAPVSLGVADFNGDGKPDLAVANYNSTNVSVLLGNGDGTFKSAISLSAGGYPAYSPESLAIADFNGDGKPDVAVAVCGGAAVLLNTCPNAGVRLAVAQVNNNVTLFWPLPYTNFVLESAASLRSTNWQGFFNETTTNNGRCEITLPFDPPTKFFRLRKP